MRDIPCYASRSFYPTSFTLDYSLLFLVPVLCFKIFKVVRFLQRIANSAVSLNDECAIGLI